MADDGSTMMVAIEAELAEAVTRAVDRGDYTSPEAVVRDALETWRERRDIPEIERQKIRALWDEGIASGPSRFDSIDDVLAEAHRRHQSASATRR